MCCCARAFWRSRLPDARRPGPAAHHFPAIRLHSPHGFRRRLTGRSVCCPRRELEARRLRYAAADLILKSSIRFPDLSCLVTHRGCLPRPAQVSEGFSGFLNFGNTGGYGRRGFAGRPVRSTLFLASSFSRSSSLFFAAMIFSASASTVAWCSTHNSSIDNDLIFALFIKMSCQAIESPPPGSNAVAPHRRIRLKVAGRKPGNHYRGLGFCVRNSSFFALLKGCEPWWHVIRLVVTDRDAAQSCEQSPA